jgi:hypothetical protein
MSSVVHVPLAMMDLAVIKMNFPMAVESVSIVLVTNAKQAMIHCSTATPGTITVSQ